MALPAKQQAFVAAYVGSARFVGTRAAIEAGYSARSAYSQAHDLLRKPEVRAAIDAELDSLRLSAGVTRARLIAELEAIAYADLTDVACWSEDGELQIVPSDKLPPEAAAALKEIRSTTSTITFQEHERTTVYKAVKQHDKVRALQLLAKIEGLVTDKVEHSGSVGLTLSELGAILGDAAPEG